MKNKAIKICVCVLILMLSAVILSTSVLSPDKANAASRLFGIQNIVDRLNDTGATYKMLEIVPDKAYASLGFLTAKAPLLGSRIFTYKNNADERKAFITSSLMSLKNAGIISYDGGYEERLYKLSNDDFKSVRVSDNADYKEERRGYFTDAIEVSFAIPTFKLSPVYDIQVKSLNENPTTFDTLQFEVEISSPKKDKFKGKKEFSIISEGLNNLNVESDTVNIVVDGNLLTFNTEANSVKFKVSASFDPEYTGTAYSFMISDGKYSSDKYIFEAPLDESSEVSIAIVEALPTNYDEDYIPTDPENANYVWVDNPEGDLHTVYINEIFYDLEYTPGGSFAKKVFELNLSEEDGLKISDNIIVETKTPSELTYLDATEYDFIYISQTSAFDFPKEVTDTFDKFSKNNDISWETAASIFEAAVNSGVPVIIDREILNDVSQFDTDRRILDNPAPSSGKHPTPQVFPKYNVPENISSVADKLVNGYNYLRLAYLFRYYIATNDSFLPSLDDSFWTKLYAESILSCGSTDINTGVVHGNPNLLNEVFEYGKFGAINGNVFINGLYESGKNLNIVRSGLETKICDYWEGYTTVSELDSRLYGLLDVTNEIINDNFYNNSLGTILTSEFSHDGTYDKVSVNGYTLLKYIVNYFNRRLMLYKDKIKVLDIEPTRYSTLTVDKVKKWFGTSGDASKIYDYEIVQMSTYEFIGKIEDLVENYDLIYIGSCIGPKDHLGSLPQHTNLTVKAPTGYFRDAIDEKYDKLIYTHIGHFTQVNRASFRGLKITDHKDDNFNNKVKNDTIDYLSRYSGNDINKTKYNDLTEYVLSGYPIVVSDKFFKNGALSNEYLDPYSYLYKFLNLVTNGGTYTHSNFNLKGEIVTKTETITKSKNVIIEQTGTIPSLVKYANMPRLSISLLDKPTEYTITEDKNGNIQSVTYLNKVNGKSYLSYTFEISNTAELRPSTSYYRVRIFTDTNADGKFNGLEELDDLLVMEADTGDVVETNELRSGIRYTVTRELSDNYIGLIPWKLVVELYEDTEFSAKTSEKGYTAVKAQECTIKVLQITGPSSYNLKLKSNDTFKNHFSNVKNKLGYDIQITETSNVGIVNTYNNGGYKSGEDFFINYLDNFDMIMIGFQDCYEDINSDDVMIALQLYIDAGKSILFSHDTTSFNNAPENADGNNPWGYHMNMFLRAQVGMDRFGITTSQTLKNLIDGVDNDDSRYQEIINYANENSFDVPYMPDGGISAYCEGFNNYEISYQKYNNTAFVDAAGMNFSDDSKRPDKITQLNDGQITTFPYNLNITEGSTRTQYKSASGYMMEKHNTLKIADTHAQYYQLNTDMDKDGDGISDLVVWYCLSGESFDAVPNDAMNGYYIYTVGNVTYTGMGHFRQQNRTSDLTLDEVKLFINTILASYRSGIKSPSVGITADTTNKNNTMSYLYRTNDSAEGTAFTADEKIGIFAKDINIVQAYKKIRFYLYYEITESEYLAGVNSADKDYYETANIDDQTVYLKAYSLDPSDEDYYGNFFEFDDSSPGYISADAISKGEMENDRILGLTLKADWLNNEMRKAEENHTSAKLYFGAWTVLQYTDRNNVVKETTKSFTKLTIRNRDFFDLD